MARALSNYSIEEEQNILLSFLDGSNIRCKPTDLPIHLAGADLERVRTALQTRHEFIRRVLPPTVTMLLLVATVVLSRYDYHRYQQGAHRSRTSSPVSDSHTQLPPSLYFPLVGEQSAVAPSSSSNPTPGPAPSETIGAPTRSVRPAPYTSATPMGDADIREQNNAEVLQSKPLKIMQPTGDINANH